MVLLTTPAAAELSVWMGDFGWAHFISSCMFLISTISLAVMKSAPSFALEAEDMTNLMICSSVRTKPFHQGMALFLEQKM